jgi:phosphoribosylanthranilate isomerase
MTRTRKVKVKVCGMTRAVDAALACELGASAVGFVFWSKSPRYVTPEQAGAITCTLPRHVSRVGVFVNPDLEEVRKTMVEAGLSAVQLHGDETVQLCDALPYPVVKAVSVDGPESVEAALGWPDRVTVLLDVHDPVHRGGTGRVVNWDLAATVASRRRVFLAGGLTPTNVGAAVVRVCPYGVDLSSGVEAAPGVKDPELLRELFAAVDNL